MNHNTHAFEIANAEAITIHMETMYTIPLGKWGLLTTDTETARRAKFIGRRARINGTIYEIIGLESFRKLDPLLGQMIVRVKAVVLE